MAYTTHFLISNNEEIGYGGNSNIPEKTVEYLAVDMGAIGDGQTTDELQRFHLRKRLLGSLSL